MKIEYHDYDLATLLREARDSGLIYWEPNTARGHVAKADLLARIDAAIAAPAAENGRVGELTDEQVNAALVAYWGYPDVERDYTDKNREAMRRALIVALSESVS